MPNLTALPKDVTGGIAPQLKGMSYMVEQNGTLLVTTGTNNVVTVAIAPN
jgi:hypothetical protein